MNNVSDPFCLESGSTVLHYDAANNLDWSATGLAITGSACSQDQAPAASQTARSYDAMNRVWKITPPTGTQGTVYTFDALGQVKTAVSGIATQSYNYNFRGMLTSETLSMAGTAYAWGLGYAHDAYGHVSAIGYPGSVSEGVAYAPDALGRASQAGSYASGVHYFPDGSEQSYLLGNGISALIQKNARLLPSGLSYSLGGTQRLNEAYVYDKDANLTNLTDLVNGQNTQTLGYDGLNRLTAASAPNTWGTQSYAYDALNNLRQNINGSNTINLNVDANNRLTSAALGTVVFTTYQNDARGNRSAMTYGGVTTQYSFDASNQLLAVPGVASYAYDAAGRRVVKTPAVGGAAAATYSFYNQAGQLLFGYDAATAQGTNYIYLNGKLIARHKGSAVTYLLTDRLGSPVREADVSGNVTASFSYRPYGDLYSGPNQSQPGFTGHVNDPETALIYMQQRYYDPGVGRFLSIDQVPPTPGNVFNISRYAYADGNPVSNTDPNGLTTWPANGAVRSEFGARDPVRNDVPHNGIDIRNPLGGNVVASDSGVVISVSNGAYGTHEVLIRNADGSISGYAHVATTVAVGQAVGEGDPIGTTDLSGRSTGPHVHYTYRPSEHAPRENPRDHLPPRNQTNPTPAPAPAPAPPPPEQRHPRDHFPF